MRLLKSHKLTFTRKSAGGGYIDPETRQWVQAPTESTFCAQGSLQPVSGRERKLLGSGVGTKETYVFLTKTEIRTYDEFSDQEPDTVTIRGNVFEAIKQENWNMGLTTDHYRVILTRKDKLNG